MHHRAIADFGLSTVSIAREAAGIPDGFVLHGDYPNPFNPETTVGFDLPEASPVTVRIFDATGRALETLVNEALPAGRSSNIWSAAGWASGISRLRPSQGMGR